MKPDLPSGGGPDQFQQVVGRADEGPFRLDPRQPPEKELAEPHGLFDRVFPAALPESNLVGCPIGLT